MAALLYAVVMPLTALGFLSIAKRLMAAEPASRPAIPEPMA